MTIRAGGKSATQSDWRMFPEGEFLFTISDAKTKTVETQYGEKERITYTLTIHEADRGHLDEEAGEPLPGLAQSDRVFASFTIPDNLVFMKSGAPQESKLGAFLIDVLGRSTEQAKALKNHLLDGGYVDLEGIVGLPVRADIVHNETPTGTWANIHAILRLKKDPGYAKVLKNLLISEDAEPEATDQAEPEDIDNLPF